MKYILYGEDTVSSRNFLLKLKSQYGSYINLDGKKLDKQRFQEAVLNSPLSKTRELIIIEDFNEKHLDWAAALQADIVFWSASNVSVVDPKVDKVFYFKDSKNYSLFRLADSVGLKQEKAAFANLQTLLEKGTNPEKIIWLLGRHFKLLVFALSSEKDKISTSDFVRRKILEQASFWSLPELAKAFRLLFETDLRIKKGILPAKEALYLLFSTLTQIT